MVLILRISARRGCPSFSTQAIQPVLIVSAVAKPFSRGVSDPPFESPPAAMMEVDGAAELLMNFDSRGWYRWFGASQVGWNFGGANGRIVMMDALSEGGETVCTSAILSRADKGKASLDASKFSNVTPHARCPVDLFRARSCSSLGSKQACHQADNRFQSQDVRAFLKLEETPSEIEDRIGN